MGKIPVYLDSAQWGQIITAIAMQHPLVAEISTQITTFNRQVNTPAPDSQETFSDIERRIKDLQRMAKKEDAGNSSGNSSG